VAELQHQREADRALRANLPPRYYRLDNLERYVAGTQYEDRPHFWDDSVPLYERAPCVVHPIVASAIRSNTDLCLGEGRWPEITACPDEDGSSFDPRFGLNEDQSEKLNKVLKAIEKQAKLTTVCSEALDSAQGSKTAVAIGCIRGGRMAVETTKAKWATPTWDETRPDVLASVEIRYPYLEEYKDTRTGAWSVRCMLYRRVIDAQADTTFKPAKASESGAEPDSWVPDPAKTVEHGFGFCPVVWYKFRASCSTVAEVDGNAIHELLLDELDAYHFAVSQRHAAAMVAASPPTIEIGVDEDHNPAPMGREARILIRDSDDPTSPSYRRGWMAAGDGTPQARKRGPGAIWRYPGADSSVSMLTLPGDALKPVDDDARDIKSKIADGLGVVLIDPDNSKFSADLSGKALTRLYDRQVRSCDKIREDFGDGFLLPLVNLLLRIALKKHDGVYLAGLKEALPVLQQFEQAVDGQEDVQWFAPDLELAWGPYFQADAQDEKTSVEMVKAAFDAGFITKRTAIEEMGDIFTIGNVDEYLETIEEEASDKAKKAVEMMQATAGTSPEPEEEEPAKAPAVPSNGIAKAPNRLNGGPIQARPFR
jgi:hypothetical protein